MNRAVRWQLGDGSDHVRRAEHAPAHDLSPQAAAVGQALVHALAREPFEMGARLAQAQPPQDDAADRELAADEVIERYAARDEVAASLARLQRNVAFLRQGGERFALDER